jgi:hypothetical protein
MAKAKKLPKTIYVKWAGEEDGAYLEADTTPDSSEHGDQVGVYELRETKTKRITHELK